MSALGRVLALTTIEPFTPATYDSVIARRSSIGDIRITSETALAIPAVYACVGVISEDIASVPLQVYEDRGDDGKAIAREHPIYDLLHDRPNRYQTALEFREMLTAFALLRGRGVAEIRPGRRGPVDELTPLHPDLLSGEMTSSGKLRYRYQDPIAKRERVLLPEELFIVRGRFGRAVLDFARETFELQHAMRSHASRMYARGANPFGILSAPKPLNDKERHNLREALDEYAAGGANEGRPMILEDGMSWTQVALTMQQAEFVATKQLGVAEIARFFRVSLHKIQELSRSTNNNIEQQAIEHVTDTIRPWAERWEQAIKRDLILAPRFFAEHNLEGLLRGDIETRYKAYALAVQWGFMIRNEVRARENLNPLDGLDEPLTPLNMQIGADGSQRMEFAPPDGAALAYLRHMVRDAAGRAVRKETAAIAKLAERTGGSGEDWSHGVKAFYREHAEFVAKLLRLDDLDARRYADGRCRLVLEEGTAALEDEADDISELTDLSLGQARPPQQNAASARLPGWRWSRSASRRDCWGSTS